jgi:hypothetical protein
MPVNDQLTAVDASFLELEQADDGALMHAGGRSCLSRSPAVGCRRSGSRLREAFGTASADDP